jgi:hypothetical protein
MLGISVSRIMSTHAHEQGPLFDFVCSLHEMGLLVQVACSAVSMN